MRERGSNKWDDLVIDFRFSITASRRYRAIGTTSVSSNEFLLIQERKKKCVNSDVLTQTSQLIFLNLP